MKKIYCYVDETGQDTGGKLFIVVVIIVDQQLKDRFEEELLYVEKQTGKTKRKWNKTAHKIKIRYLNMIFSYTTFVTGTYCFLYTNTKKYSFSIAQAIIYSIGKKIVVGDYTTTIVIDGLNEAERIHIQQHLKKNHIPYRKVRGMKDEQSAYVRLVDAIAGFVRDVYEGESYTWDIKKPGCLDLVTQHCEEVG